MKKTVNRGIKAVWKYRKQKQEGNKRERRNERRQAGENRKEGRKGEEKGIKKGRRKKKGRDERRELGRKVKGKHSKDSIAVFHLHVKDKLVFEGKSCHSLEKGKTKQTY